MSVTTDRRLIPFLLRRPGKGVRLIPTGDAALAAFLVEVSPWTGLLYDPREQAPHLLEEFTQLTIEPESFARFASQWGLLGLGRAVPSPDPDDPNAAPIEPKEGEFDSAPIECTADWARVLLEIRTAGELHGALRARDREAVASRVALDEGWLWFSEAFFADTDRLLALAGDDQLDQASEWNEGSDLSVAPLAYVACAECPDGNFERAAWDLLAWAVNTRTQHLIGYGLRAPDPRRPHALRLQLTHRGQLYAWLWLQLAERIAAGPPMQRCRACGNWYFQNPTARRQHGMYCSTRCRVAAWRERKARPRSGRRMA